MRSADDAPDTGRAPRVFIGNFDVEQQWARDLPGLPTPTTRTATAVVAATDELSLLLGGEGDWAVVKSGPHPDLLEGFERVGLPYASPLAVEHREPARPVTEDALASPGLLRRLTEIGDEGGRLVPHGFSTAESRLCEATGLRAPMPDPGIAERVNSKIFSRRLCRELGIDQPPGWEAETLSELESLAGPIGRRIDDGVPVGIKSALGVSGKGILVCETRERLDRLLRMLARRRDRDGVDRLAVVAEEWQDKRTDLNYHFTIADDGRVGFDYVLEAVTEGGTHRGHLLPDRLAPAIREQLSKCGHLLGERLAAEGYRGPVGVDAITCADDRLFPVLEINARNNMSTYLGTIHDRIRAAGSVGAAVQIDLSLGSRLRFERLAAAIGDDRLGADWELGFLVTCFSSANSAAELADARGRFKGRVHGVVVAPDLDRLTRIEASIRSHVKALEVPNE